MLHPDEQRRVVDEGHEVAIHSWIHELNSALAPEDERELQMRSADKLEEITGVSQSVSARLLGISALTQWPSPARWG